MSSMAKLTENAPLLVLLFAAVYQGVSFISIGHAGFGGLFILSALSYMLYLYTYPHGIKVNAPFIIASLLFSWLVFSFSYSFLSAYEDKKVLSLEWLYVLSICAYMILTLKLANILNILAWIIALFLVPYAMGASAIEANRLETLISVAMCLVLLNVMLSQMAALKNKLRKAQTIDALTGCIHPNQLKQEMSKAADLSQRYSTRVSNLLFRFDQDQQLLTLLGQKHYEVFLNELAQVCKSRLRTTDVLCRYNDEAFIIFLPSTGEENACYLAEDLLMACEAYSYSAFTQESQPVDHMASLNFSYQTSEYDVNDSWEVWFHKTIK